MLQRDIQKERERKKRLGTSLVSTLQSFNSFLLIRTFPSRSDFVEIPDFKNLNCNRERNSGWNEKRTKEAETETGGFSCYVSRTVQTVPGFFWNTSCNQCYKRFTGLYLQVCKSRPILQNNYSPTCY